MTSNNWQTRRTRGRSNSRGRQRRDTRLSIEALEVRDVPAAPTIAGSILSEPFLDVPAAGPANVSGVLNDPTDPARTLGLVFTIADAETPVGSLKMKATSSNTAVVPNASLVLSGNGANRTLKITPTAVGFTTITVTVTDGQALSQSYVVNYAASAASNTPNVSRFFTGAADASTAIAVDSDYMFVANDEDQALRLYHRKQSGLPVASFDFTNVLGLTEIDKDTGQFREVDIEASTRVGNRLYWMGSMSNRGGEAKNAPNRNRVFATDLTGVGAAAGLTFVGHYDNLLQDLVAWDVNDIHKRGANFFGFAASEGAGKPPEADDGSGFNLEALTMAPGSATTAYLGFRAPIASAANRTKALIVPITNFDQVVNGIAPVFGVPIELDLNTPGEFGPRGIRSMESNGTQILIVAGPPATAPANAVNPFKLFVWDGNAANAPQAQSVSLAGLNPETIIVPTGPLTATTVLQLLSDNGDTIFYNDGTPAKSLPRNNFKKSRSDLIALGSITVVGSGPGGSTVKVYEASTGTLLRTFDPYPQFLGGSNVATGDFNGDGFLDIITGAGAGGGPHVKIFDGRTNNVLASFMAYSPSFSGGVFVAAGDVNGDGKIDVITGAGRGGGPHVRAFSGANIGDVLASFMAYTPAFAGGVRVASGDLNNDNKADIITAAGPGGGPHIKAFSGANSATVLQSFMAYAPTFRGGVSVAAGDVNRDGVADIITAPGAGAGAGPLVKIFNGAKPATVLQSFMAYDARFTGGVFVGARDVNLDGVFDVLTGPEKSSASNFKAFSGSSPATVLQSFVAFDPKFLGGIRVS